MRSIIFQIFAVLFLLFNYYSCSVDGLESKVELSAEITSCLGKLKMVRAGMTACLNLLVPKRPQLQSDNPYFQQCQAEVIQSNKDLEAEVARCEHLVQNPNNPNAVNTKVQRIFQSWGRL